MDQLYIATPTYDGSVTMAYAQSLLRTYENCRVNGIDVYTDYHAGCPYVDLARNILVHRFLKSTAQAMLFIDADMGFEHTAAAKLFKLGLPLVGGVYPRKQDIEGYPIGTLEQFNGECQEATFLPTGFMLIRREVFEALRDRCTTFPDDFTGERIHVYFQVGYYLGGMVGEDVEFCLRYRRVGGKAWLYPDIKFEHHGVKAWRGNFADYTAKRNPLSDRVINLV